MALKSSKHSKAENKGRSAKLERLKQEFDLHETVGTTDRFEFDREPETGKRPEKKRKATGKDRKKSSRFITENKEKPENRPYESTRNESTVNEGSKKTSGKTVKENLGQTDQNSENRPKREESAHTDTGTFEGNKGEFRDKGKLPEQNEKKERKLNLKKARQKKEASELYEKNKTPVEQEKKPEEIYKENKRDFHESPPEFKGERGNFDFEGVEKTDGISPRDRQKLKRYRKQSEKYHKKAENIEKKLPKEVELKYVTDKKTGESKLILEKRIKDEKDIKGKSRRSMVKKANREIFERTWKKEEEEEKQEYNSDDNSQDIYDLGRDSAERLFDVKDFVQDSRSAYQRRKYEEFNRAEEKAFNADANLKYETERLFKDNPEVNDAENKKFLQKEIQKRRIKRNYAKEFRDNANKAKEAMEAGEATTRGIKNIGDLFENVKAFFDGGTVAPLFIAIAIIALVIIILMTVFGGLFIGGGSVAAITASTYLSDMDDIDAAEVYFTKLETDLQKSLDEDEIKSADPGITSVDVVISGEISHNPYTLISYLSAVHGVFEYNEDLEKEIDELFNKCYEVKETTSGELHQVNVQVKTLEEVISDLMDDTSKGLYYLYSISHGLVQVFASPCDYYWGMLISKNYGYQQNAKTGDIEYHNGITLSVPTDTAVYAGIAGIVAEVGETEDYGKYVVISDEEHYTVKYGYLSDINVSIGSDIKAGDTIGETKEDDESISGSSLYLECQYDGTYYNPCFLFSGYFGETDILKELGIPTDTGATESGSLDSADYDMEVSEESFFEIHEESIEKETEEAQNILFPSADTDRSGNPVINEGMKWLGKPYLFSGSNPETGIDCSGFVDWCFEKSGVRAGLPHSCEDIYKECIPVAANELKIGDLVFFQGTYKQGISHVGIYCGNGEMIHAGDPIQVTSLTKQYYQKHFFGYGRIIL